MAMKACPNPSFECPWFSRKTPAPLKNTQEHGCFSDLDHKVPQRLARIAGATALQKAYILDSQDNRQQICRWEHEEKGAQGDDPMPSNEYMMQTLARELMQGIVDFSDKQKKQIGL